MVDKYHMEADSDIELGFGRTRKSIDVAFPHKHQNLLRLDKMNKKRTNGVIYRDE